MIRVDIKRTQFYMENSLEDNCKYFTNKKQNYIHGIDNIYYSIFIKDDYNDNKKVDRFLSILDSHKEQLKVDKDDSINFHDNLVLTKKKFSIYEYCLSRPELYDIFISDYLPNSKTPRIVVQIRSMALWMNGYDYCINDSFLSIEVILKLFGLEIDRTCENRIDYCYHTNIIQSPLKYFSDNNLCKMLNTNFDIYSKIGHVYKSQKGYGSDMTLEYVSLGNRKSNNLFFRIYDKTKEVVEQGYKSFFIDLWYKHGLISYYDKYCFEYAYKYRNYDYIHKARLNFYLEYGSDILHKREIQSLLSDVNATIFEIKQLADLLMPSLTTILNIEFETRRKFYYTVDDQVFSLPCSVSDLRLKKLYIILENRKLFLDYLTDKTVSFRDNKMNMLDWWERLRSLKLLNVNEVESELLRKYSNNLEIDKIKKSIIRKIASNSIYNNNSDTGFVADLSDFLASINDNDIMNGILDYREKGIEKLINNELLYDYRIYKKKKYKALKSRISLDAPMSIVEKS